MMRHTRRPRAPQKIGKRARATVEPDGRFRYTWPCGHFRIEPAPTVPAPGGKKQPMNPAMLKLFARHWADGVQCGPCPTCDDRDPEVIDRAALRP
jgi:hypothetical protein